MKTLTFILILFTIVLTSCTKMDYTYQYITKAYDDLTDDTLPEVQLNINVIEQKEPDLFVLECSFKSDILVDVNAISIKINYDPDAITFTDSLFINEKLYINEYKNINLLGITLYNITETQVCYSFTTVQESIIKDEFIFRQMVKIHSPTFFRFSAKPDDVEVANYQAKAYPLQVQYVEFIKNE